eukprot:1158069-Pelagomonas_calceolata.AAC.6
MDCNMMLKPACQPRKSMPEVSMEDYFQHLCTYLQACQELAKSTKDALSQAQEVSSSAGGASPDQQYKQKKLLQDFAAILQVVAD